jgi:branched-chain amino acid aminotransferase
VAQRAPLVHFSGRLVPPEEAVISALSPALSHGPIIYETLRAYWNEQQRQLYLFRLEDHLRRLTASMRVLRFEETFPTQELGWRIIELARANELKQDAYFRLQVFPEGRDARRQATTGPGILIVAEPRGRTSPKPVTCQVSAWRRPGDDGQPARVKAVGVRMFARVAAAQARAEGYDQVILLNERGKLAEGASSNIFIVRFGVASTPPRSASILEGVTRASLMALLREQDMACEERDVDRSELYDCEEAFLCSTGLEVVPIASVDGLSIGDGTEGPVTRRLRKSYETVVRGSVDAWPEWRTPVYKPPEA